MFQRQGRRPSVGTVISVVALVFALAGSAIALPGKNNVDANDIKKNAVKTKALKNGAVKKSKLGNGSVTTAKLADGAVTTPKIAANAVDSGRIADNAVTSAKVANATPQALELRNSFAAAPSPFAPPTYAVDGEGIVHLRGHATKANSTAGAMARLPEGARPAANVYAPAVCITLGSIVPALATIDPTNGNITVDAASGVAGDQDVCENQGVASLDGISFPLGS